MPPQPDLALLAETLARHRVDYVLIGGMAVVIHGGATVTHDSDIAFNPSDDNVERLANALEELHAKPKRWLTTNYRLAKGDLSSHWLRLDSDAGDIDLVKRTPGVDYEQLKKNRETMTVQNVRILVASVESLIQIKKAAGREKDLLHILELETLAESPDAR